MTSRGLGSSWPARLLILAFVVLLGACASGGRPTFSRQPGQGNNVTITVENQNFLDATVYALWIGTRDRVGAVTGLSTQTFQVDWRASDLQLQIELLADGTMTTDRIGVFEGDHVELVIPPTP